MKELTFEETQIASGGAERDVELDVAAWAIGTTVIGATMSLAVGIIGVTESCVPSLPRGTTARAFRDMLILLPLASVAGGLALYLTSD